MKKQIKNFFITTKYFLEHIKYLNTNGNYTSIERIETGKNDDGVEYETYKINIIKKS